MHVQAWYTIQVTYMWVKVTIKISHTQSHSITNQSHGQNFGTTSKMNIQMSIEMSCHCYLDFSDEHTTNQGDQYHAGLKVIGKEQRKN